MILNSANSYNVRRLSLDFRGRENILTRVRTIIGIGVLLAHACASGAGETVNNDYHEIQCEIHADWIDVDMRAGESERTVAFVSTGVKFIGSPIWSAMSYFGVKSVVLSDVQKNTGTLTVNFFPVDGQDQGKKVVGRITEACFDAIHQYLMSIEGAQKVKVDRQ